MPLMIICECKFEMRWDAYGKSTERKKKIRNSKKYDELWQFQEMNTVKVK